MEELYKPTGGPWGSDYIDDHFDALLDEIFGSGAVRAFQSKFPANYTTVRDNFRKQKMNFYNNEDARFLKVELTLIFKNEIAEYSSKNCPQIANETDDFESIIESAHPFGLEAGKHLKCEGNDLFISSTIWREHLFDKVINPMIAQFFMLRSYHCYVPLFLSSFLCYLYLLYYC